MAEASLDFKTRLGLSPFVVVADRGMLSAANVQALQAKGIEYAIAERLRRSTAYEALARAGRYTRVTRNLEAKGDQERPHRAGAGVPHLERAAADARQRDAIAQQLQDKIASGGVLDQLKAGARRFLKLSGASPEIDLKKVQKDARYDGKWVLRTTRTPYNPGVVSGP